MAVAGSTDWRKGKTCEEMLEYMFEKQVSCDVTLQLSNGITVGAHSFILACKSEVFETMFSDKWRKSEAVVIEGVSAEAFRQFLKYLYSDQIYLGESMMMEIFHIARKYMVYNLQERCLQHFKDHMTPDNVWTILQHALMVEEQGLVDTALEFIDYHAEECLSSTEFMKVSREILCKVIGRGFIGAKEVVIFRACLDWAGARCLEEDKFVGADGIRRELGDALCLIRFPLIDISDFTNTGVGGKILSKTDMVKVFHALAKPPANLKFSDEKRKSKSAVFISGETRCVSSETGSSFCIFSFKPPLSISVDCVFLAFESRDVMKKLKCVIITDGGNRRHETSAIVETSVPRNKGVNGKATFSEPIVLEKDQYHTAKVELQFDPALNRDDMVKFTGHVRLIINGTDCSVARNNCGCFLGFGLAELTEPE